MQNILVNCLLFISGLQDTYCDFEDTDICKNDQVSSNLPWKRWFGPTPTNNTGPSMAVNYLNSIPGVAEAGINPFVSGNMSLCVYSYAMFEARSYDKEVKSS